MKKTFTLFGTLAFALTMSAQVSFSDDFEGYTSGAYIGPNSPDWTTWSGNQGGSEDVQVTTNQANSGTQSIYFSSTSSSGGPQDVVLPFGGQYNTGTFTYGMSMYFVTNKGGYFNFQANTTVGQLWALECYFTQNGIMTLRNTDGIFMVDTVPIGAWFDLQFNINLNTNTWDVLVDSVLIGSFSNTVNQIASIDIYPVNSTTTGGNNQAGFYVDDVFYDYAPYVLPTVNAAVLSIDDYTGLTSQSKNITATVRNLGVSTITSFDLTLNYNSGTVNQSFTGLNLASLATAQYTFTSPVTLAAGNLPLSVTVSNVNTAGADGDANDDSKTVQVDPVTPAANKVVVIEEATGTWCQWCPRGAVFMDALSKKYGDFYAGVAVHNADPMTNTTYDNGIGLLLGTNGYPSALVDRGTVIDPADIEPDFLQRVVTPGNAAIVNGATWNATTRQLDVSLTYTFSAPATTAWRVACVLTEDSVTGTGGGYAQANAYSGGGAGIMGGFENLPDPVPAAQMNYNHVAREIIPGFSGYPNSFTTAVNAGDVHTFNISIIVPANRDINQMHIVGLLIDNTGEINNGSISTVNEAITTGFVTGTNIPTGINTIAQPDLTVQLYPNPTNGSSFLTLNLDQQQEVQISIVDMSGRTIAVRNYGELNGAWTLPLNTEEFSAGLYSIQIRIGDTITTKRLVVE